MTQEKDNKLYAGCFLFYEQIETKENEIYYFPKCISIISHYPLFALFKQLLEFLSNSFKTNIFDECESIERILDNFLFEIPMATLPTVQVSVKIGSDIQIISCSPFYANFQIEQLFHFLSIDNIIKIVGWILTERTIVFVSKDVYLLGLIIQSFLWLIEPFKWCYSCFAVIPQSCEYILQSLQPTLAGICGTEYKPHFEKPDGIAIIYLDSNKIETSFSANDCSLPLKVANMLKNSILQICDSAQQIKNPASQKEIKICFLTFLNELVCNPNPTEDIGFQTRFLGSQIFQQYQTQLNSKDETSDFVSLPSKMKEISAKAKGNIISDILVTSPDPETGIEKKNVILNHVLNKIENFPNSLNNSLFLNSQSIPWETIKVSNENEETKIILKNDIEYFKSLDFVHPFLSIMKENRAKAKKFWRISNRHKTTENNMTQFSRNNNRLRAVTCLVC